MRITKEQAFFGGKRRERVRGNCFVIIDESDWDGWGWLVSRGGEATEVKPIAPGALVAGMYRIVRCLGMGRTGAVYLCEVAEEEGKDPPPLSRLSCSRER